MVIDVAVSALVDAPTATVVAFIRGLSARQRARNSGCGKANAQLEHRVAERTESCRPARNAIAWPWTLRTRGSGTGGCQR
jgi:hypothetical protein